MQPVPRLRRFALPGLKAAAILLLAGAAPPPGGLYGDYLCGRFAAEQGRLRDAADYLERARALDPATPELRLQAFLAAALAGRPDALALARGMPDLQAAQLLLANDAAAAGRFDEAARRDRALPRDPLSNVLRPLLLAWAAQGRGRTDEALGLLRGSRSAAARPVYLLHAALIADLAHRPEAGALYREARAAYPGLNLRLAQILASWQARQGAGGRAAAEAGLARMAAESPELSVTMPGLRADIAKRPVGTPAEGLAEAYLALAASLRRDDQANTAMLLLRFSLQLRPDFTAAKLLLSEFQEGRRHYAAAADTLADVPDADPLIGLVLLRRAILAQRAGDAPTALRILDQLAREAPDSAVPPMQRGDILREAGRFPEAVGAYDAAVAKLPHPGPGNWSLFYARAIAHDGARQWPEAEADLEHALRLSPDQPSVMNYLGYSLAERGQNLPRARQLLQKAAEERPNEGAIIDSLGFVILRQGDVPEAIDMLERAVELEPEDPVINAHLGDAYRAAGRALDARYQWQHALLFHPTDKDRASLEAKLREPSEHAAATP